MISQSVTAPETRRMLEKLAGSMSVLVRANLQSTELAAKATIARSVRSIV